MKITHGMMAALQNVRMKGVRVRFTEDYAEAMITAVAPLILEEAAKVVMRLAADEYRYIPDARGALGEAAIAIRVLTSPQADQPPAASSPTA